MDDAAKARAESITAHALADGNYEDFREPYRERLRWLKETNAHAFTEALAHYGRLVDNIAKGNDPLREWLDYGKQLGELSGRGTVYSVDESGLATEGASAMGALLLHLPNDQNIPALPLAIPRSLSDHQRATLDLLVRRKLAME